MICRPNQLTDFYVRGALVFNRLIKTYILLLLQALNIDSPECAFGKTKLFIRDPRTVNFLCMKIHIIGYYFNGISFRGKYFLLTFGRVSVVTEFDC